MNFVDREVRGTYTDNQSQQFQILVKEFQTEFRFSNVSKRPLEKGDISVPFGLEATPIHPLFQPLECGGLLRWSAGLEAYLKDYRGLMELMKGLDRSKSIHQVHAREKKTLGGYN